MAPSSQAWWSRMRWRAAEFVVGLILSVFGWGCFVLLSSQCGGVNFYGGTPCWSTGSSADEARSNLGLLAAGGIGLGSPLLVHATCMILFLNICRLRDEGPATAPTETTPLAQVGMVTVVASKVNQVDK